MVTPKISCYCDYEAGSDFTACRATFRMTLPSGAVHERLDEWRLPYQAQPDRAALLSIIRALETLSKPCEVVLYTPNTWAVEACRQAEGDRIPGRHGDLLNLIWLVETERKLRLCYRVGRLEEVVHV